MVEEIRERVRARHPEGGAAGSVPLVELLALMHARDAAEGKVASIGTLNPRPPGLWNSLIQSVKRLVARALDWHVREQVEFNRAVMRCVQSSMEAFAETNRALAALQALADPAAESWRQWFRETGERVERQEIQYLKNLAELERGFEHQTRQLGLEFERKAAALDASYRDLIRAQHSEFTSTFDRAQITLRDRYDLDLHRLRAEIESLIHSELRVLRQRAAAAPLAAGPFPPPTAPLPSAPAPLPPAPTSWDDVDWLRFAERFRGSEDYIRSQQRLYAQNFASCSPILDAGCGRGELLETLRDAGLDASGIELNPELVNLCRSRGLDAVHADLFEFLRAAPPRSYGGIASIQVVEHLPRPRLPELFRLAFAALRPGGLLAIETPNPECLAIFATHFYLDPTHRHPLPPSLLAFLLEEAGFVDLRVEPRAPAPDSFPELNDLPEPFRRRFFGFLDYTIFARKPGP